MSFWSSFEEFERIPKTSSKQDQSDIVDQNYIFAYGTIWHIITTGGYDFWSKKVCEGEVWKEIIPPSIDLKIWLKWIKMTFSWICWTYSQHPKVDQNVDTLVQKNFTSARCTFWWSMNGHVWSRCVPASTCPQNGINSVRDMLCWRDTMWRPRLLVHFGNIWVSRSIYGATPKQTAQ